MFNTYILSKKIGEKIANELNLDNENKEVISYGIFAIIQILYNILLIILFGVIFNVVIESLMVSFTISVLRKSSGGAHSRSSIKCLIEGTFIAVSIGLLSKIDIDFNINILIGIITFVWSYYIIYKLAPVDNPAKPIRTEKKKKRLKKSSIITLSIYLIIVIFSFITYMYFKFDRILIYSNCILGGVMWQVLSLTKVGHTIVESIDTFLNILTVGRGE